MYFYVIMSIIIISFIFNSIVEYLNLKNVTLELPKEFKDVYSDEKYKQSQLYLKDSTNFGLFSNLIATIFSISLIIFGGFNIINKTAEKLVDGPILTGLVFIGILFLANILLSLPFSYYNTFVIEEKFGFNKMDKKTFIIDNIKSLIIIAVLGLLIFSGIFWFFGKFESTGWLYCWIAFMLFQLIILYIAPVLIMPLFNKYEPLEDGELKTAIEKFAKSQEFNIEGIYVMDMSKRTTKSNAFFTGFGKFRRIVFSDTLIENHSIDEIVGILAHEIGHFKKKHIFKNVGISFLSSGLMLFLMTFFIKNEGLFQAFGMEGEPTIYASLVFFGFLFSPINIIFSIFTNYLSRKFEYEADQFAVETVENGSGLGDALKKLSIDSLSNLSPHPLKVFIEYSHPPVLFRIRRINELVKLKK